jgi:hypothetical protein
MNDSIHARLDAIMDSVKAKQSYGNEAMDYAAAYGYARVMLLNALLDMTPEKREAFLIMWERISEKKAA